MIERHSKVFVPVSAGERLPEKSGMYMCYLKLMDAGLTFAPIGYQQFDADKNEWVNPSICYQSCEVTHWLEEKENVYVLTEDELKGLLLRYSKELAMYYDFAVMPDRIYEPRIEQFLQSKTNPQTENK